MSRSRTIVIGDVHGCLDELDELLRAVELRPVDRIVLAGDLMDRGPDPAGVVRRARELGALAVLGNHEEKHLRWRRHESRRAEDPSYRNPMTPFPDERRAQHDALGEDDWHWISALPTWLRLSAAGRRWLVVHAGFEPRWPLKQQNDRIVIRIREVDDRGKFVSSGDPRVPVEGAVPWATRWRGRESVVYGHHVHALDAPRVDRHREGVECWGIDTGCVFGGHLSALVLETREVVQVKALREYVALDGADLD